jgi:hypothetical protein
MNDEQKMNKCSNISNLNKRSADKKTSVTNNTNKTLCRKKTNVNVDVIERNTVGNNCKKSSVIEKDKRIKYQFKIK